MTLGVPIVLLALLPAALALYGPLELPIGMSDNAKMYIVCEHNRMRGLAAKGQLVGKKTQPKAANMQALCWCEELVAKAQEHASNCGGPPHDVRAGRKTENFADVGQNLMDTMQSTPIDEAMQAFLEEFNGYEFDTNSCDPKLAGRAHVCGHYTALAWSETKCVGCAYNRCAGSTFGRLVCNYGPGGNIEGKQPYVKGEPCSQCKSGQVCLNGSLCSDPVICSDKNRCSPPSSGTGGGDSCVDKAGAAACAQYVSFYNVCSPTSAYNSFGLDSCKSTCKACGGVDSGKVCTRAFDISSDLCEKLSTIDRKECVDGNGIRYAGTKSTTKSGNTCMAWNTNDPGTNYYNDFEFPDRSKPAAQNYCRNPASSGTGPWCYTTNPSVRWEYCDIPKC